MLPREKFVKRSIDALSDVELIAILLSTGTKGRGFMQISQDVARKIKKVSTVDEIFVSIRSVSGVGDVKAMKIVAGIEFGRRLFGKEDVNMMIVNSNQAYQLLKGISKYKQEHFVALYLNARYEVLLKQTINIGSVNSVSVLPRDVITPGLECNCAYVVLAHNHPSGGLSASEEDVIVTRNIAKACNLVGIKLLDHLVITTEGWVTVEI